eukprot:TRINITY_DN1148_c0_g2_i2.p3 TRINITY_DN1148_c0_g2~~TRINITY_DN1148_c0_g2_i2.p3  ORF type:complete len:204 (+),score=14.62 TRINITY_DN1148_c0_g2_i2:133-744(+)
MARAARRGGAGRVRAGGAVGGSEWLPPRGLPRGAVRVRPLRSGGGCAHGGRGALGAVRLHSRHRPRPGQEQHQRLRRGVGEGGAVFRRPAAGDAPAPLRRCSVVVDVSCDPNNPKNPVPVYNECTTFEQPVLRVRPPTAAQKPLDVVAIDHLPSLVPSESSAEFSAALVPMLLDFEADREGVWRRALAFYHATSARLARTHKL